MKFKVCLLMLFGSVFAYGQNHSDAARTFLSSLTETQKKKAIYTYEHQERFNWNFVPTSRNGISFHELNPDQRDAATALLRSSLSEQGYKKATGIIALENILREVEGRSKDDTYRDPQKYFFTFFGEPGGKSPWGWRIEGHHLALNFTSMDGEIISSTPSFNGANPGVVKTGAASGTEVLKLESDLGFLLLNSLTPDQLKVARFSETALPEIVTGNSLKADLLTPRGILYNDLSDAQKKIFKQLLAVFVDNYELGFSNKLWKKIERMGYDKMAFAWAGSLQPGKGHYYRLQGLALLIEFDNTQNNANHIHTVVRDLTNDFAEDILKEHYEKEHKKN